MARILTSRDLLTTPSPYIPLTAIDCTIPALLIDRNTPLDVLHANAVARVLAVTQLLETFSSRDLLNVLGWRLQPA